MNAFRYTRRMETPPHRHDEYAFIYLLRGAAEYVQFDCIEVVRRGEVIVTNGGTLHASCYLPDGEAAVGVAFVMGTEVFHRLLGTMTLPRIPGNQRLLLLGKLAMPECLPLVERAATELANRRSGYGLVVEGMALQFVVETLRMWPREMMSGGVRTQQEMLSRIRFIQTLEYIASAPPEAVDLSSLSSTLGISAARCNRLFRATTSLGLREYYSERLRREAAQLHSGWRPGQR